MIETLQKYIDELEQNYNNLNFYFQYNPKNNMVINIYYKRKNDDSGMLKHFKTILAI